MIHFRIHFSYPLLLLIFLLGLAMTALLYFRLSKKYRKNRNRITSTVLHLIVLALAVLTLAGTMFTYEIPNKENQIILLVDVSDTTEQSARERERFIETVLDMGQYDGYSIGIVTFGFDQVYAVELTDQIDAIMERYNTAEKPDTSATDIAAALTYAATLFQNPESAKIVLVTDGKETDEEASAVIRTVAAKGIRVDVANISTAYEGSDMQLIDSELPDYYLKPGSQCKLSVSLYSKIEGNAALKLYDNGKLIATQQITVSPGIQNVTFQHEFDKYGMHELSFVLESDGDLLEENNTYYTYLNLENFNKILILEHKAGESERLKQILTAEGAEYDVTVKNLSGDENLPKTLSDLRQYDQILLNNIANSDLPEGLDMLLYRYVNECGGGLFTVGGADLNPNATDDNDKYIAHSYNRDDMLNTLFQEILPVQAINYTPPVAVMIIVDRSGSMSAVDPITGGTKFDLALSGAVSCLNALTARDYIGLMTLDTDYDTLLPLTPRTQESRILEAINNASELGSSGGTDFAPAIERASRALLSVDVARRHVIIVTDGMPGDKEEDYLPYVKQYHENNGITYSVVGIGLKETEDAGRKMKNICDLGGGRLQAFTDAKETSARMREELNAPEIKEVNYEKFYPTATDTLSALFSGIPFAETEEGGATAKMTVSLDGFFGVRVKSGAELLLIGDYDVPIYAQWRFGKGMVGSFMCDLNGVWSSDFLSGDGSGETFVLNVVSTLMPTESVRENEISVTVKQDNYTNTLSIFTSLGEGEYITGELLNLSDPAASPIPLGSVTAAAEGTRLTDLACYITSALDASSNYSRCGFVIKQGGIYQLTLKKMDTDGKVLAEYQTHRSFSYSEEYNNNQEITDLTLAENLEELAGAANGKLIADNEDPIEVFSNFVTSIPKSFDPRYLFMILALVLFLTDVAVRKFKFKWPHEIVRNYRDKRKGKRGGSAS